MKINYEELGLRVGLELHQQLNTKHKLFCKCPTRLEDKEPDEKLTRRLRPTQSELGEVDPAALFEWEKGRYYIYEVLDDCSCLVEADEEPPHNLNMEAVETALIISMLLHSRPVDEVHVMRKIVIDGSNTTGFQRTAIVALGGYVEDDEGKIGIQTICLEEDAARKIREEGKGLVYRLDRLGIPLIEIATTPDIKSPQQAERVAFKIGQLLRITGRVRRGIGTIRQDLNVSIKGGEKIEIKGVQQLDLIGKVVEYEAIRQLNLLKIKDELQKRGLNKDDVKEEFIDVTETFKNSKSKIIRRVLARGGVVLALKLKGMRGILGWEIQPGRRFGTELADYAKYFGEVGGLFHTDELPAYGITMEEVKAAAKIVNADLNRDAIVFIADIEDRAKEALKAVTNRVKMAFDGVPKESRAANADGTTRFMRPQPGAARMYPETDVPPIEITNELLDKIKLMLPEPPERKYEKFVKKYNLSSELALQMLRSYRLDLFERLVENYGDKISPTIIATTLEATLKHLKSDNVPIENITDEHLEDTIRACAEGVISKEAIPEVLKVLANEPQLNVEKAIKRLGIEKVSLDAVERYVRKIVNEKLDEIKARGPKAFSMVMGLVMKVYRGKVDGKIVSEIVKKVLSDILKS